MPGTADKVLRRPHALPMKFLREEEFSAATPSGGAKKSFYETVLCGQRCIKTWSSGYGGADRPVDGRLARTGVETAIPIKVAERDEIPESVMRIRQADLALRKLLLLR